jgi:hypothetical protein
MKHHISIASALLLSLLLCTPDLATAGSKGKGTKGGGKKQGQVTVSPDSASTSVSSHQLNVCVSGFSEGNFVSIAVPWVGTPESHSNLSFSGYVDPSGGFCVQCPPDWTTLNLQPGTYTVQVFWYASGSSSHRQTGPTTSFEVAPAR